MLQVALSIGAIYAFIPIVIIIILIAAAAGLTRGSDLFAVFGIGALMGIKGATAAGGAGRGLKSGLNVPKSTIKAAKKTGGLGNLGKKLVKKTHENVKNPGAHPEAAHVEALATSGKEAQLRGIAPTPAQAAAMAAVATVGGTAVGMEYNRTRLVEQTTPNGPSKAAEPRIARRTTDDRQIGEIRSKHTDRWGNPLFRANIPIVGLAAAGAARLYDRLPSQRGAAAQRRASEESLSAHTAANKKLKGDREKMIVDEFIKEMQRAGQKPLSSNALAMAVLRGKVSEERIRRLGKRGAPPPPPAA